MQKFKALSLSKSNDNFSIFFILFSTFLGTVVRFFPVLLSSFPLSDGGLFYRMAQDLLEHNYVMPLFVTYNGTQIPFSYPPLAFYLMAGINSIFHVSLIDQLHYLPAFLSALTIPTIFFLSKNITGSNGISALATFAFALMPNSFMWFIMGGGITRSIGLLFGTIALIFVWRLFQSPKISSLILSILFCSLTILSHPATAWFIFLTSLLIGLSYGRNKKGILHAILTIVGVLLLTSPWWIVIIQRFGLSSVINAFRTSGFLDISILLFNFTGESMVDILAVIALLGLLAEITRGRYFLFLWLVVISVLSPRSGQMMAMLPAAILFGSGIVWVLTPGLLSNLHRIPVEIRKLADIFREKPMKIAFGVILFYALISAMVKPFIENSLIYAVSSNDQQAMLWASQNTEKESRFAVVTGGEWPTDFVSEWFPALSMRSSIATIQGSEWMPNHQFERQIDLYVPLQSCATQDFSCISSWARDNQLAFSYLYITRSKANNHEYRLPLAYASAPADHFQLAYENPGVIIYKIIGTP